MNDFFQRLKQRKLVQWAIAYVAAAFALLQGLDIVANRFDLPSNTIRLVILAMIVGFFVTLILAWYHGERGAQRVSGTELLIIGLVLLLGGGLLWHFGATASKESKLAALPNEQNTKAIIAIPAKSIAVLPFANLSLEKENAFFASGIQDEILTRLAKIGSLKVISRTSTQQFQSKPGNLAEIARQLGVATVLEGSVQKANEQVRVNVQLINAQTDSHLWADTFDRKLTDIFSVESEIARAVAEALQAKLTGGEEQALATKPTDNPAAYDNYLRGLAAEGEIMHSVYAFEKAVGYYEKAVQLDPNFALAWARLSRANSELYFSPNDPTPVRREAATHALEVAQKLQPSSTDTRLAVAVYQHDVLRDFKLAAETFRVLSKDLPGSSVPPSYLAEIARRNGQWEESNAYYEQALVLDPRNTRLLDVAALNYAILRQFPAARRLYDLALEISPNDVELKAFKAVTYQAEGNLPEAARLLEDVTAEASSVAPVQIKANQLIYERKPEQAVQFLQTRVARYHFGSELERGVFTTLLAMTQHFTDPAAVKVTCEQARRILAPICKQQPDNNFASIFLAKAYALSGDKEAARRETQRRIEALLAQHEEYRRRSLDENTAYIEALFGENDRAITTLAELLKVPYFSEANGFPITVANLHLDPTWDPLRKDPSFQNMLTTLSGEKDKQPGR